MKQLTSLSIELPVDVNFDVILPVGNGQFGGGLLGVVADTSAPTTNTTSSSNIAQACRLSVLVITYLLYNLVVFQEYIAHKDK